MKIRRLLFLTAAVLLILSPRAWAGVDEKFLAALRQVESSGNDKSVGDKGKAIGPYQIHWAYWKDATDFDKSIGGKYEDVVKLDYAIKVMASYLRRYCPKAVTSGNYEVLARVHNGGPNGANKVATINYWQRVKTELDKAKK